MRLHSSRLLNTVLTSAPVAISLALLVLNDWYLKPVWGNGLTGKLSDFAGIFLLALIAFAAIQTVAARFELPCTDCDTLKRSAEYSDSRTSLRYVILADSTIRFWVGVGFRGMGLPDGTKHKARKIKGVLRHTLEDYLGPIEFRTLPDSRHDLAPDATQDTR